MRGYDHPRFHQVTVLDLQFCEGAGSTTTADWSKAHREPNTLTGAPAWTNAINDLTFLNFDCAAPYDHIVTAAANTVDLDFTSGDFSGAVWIYSTAGGNRYVFNKGLTTTGWCFYLNTANRMSVGTRQAAASQYTTGDVISLNTWLFVSFSRASAAVQIYTNGRNTTSTAATHVNPDSAAAQNFYIGCNDAVGAGWWCGYMWRPRLWSRQLTAAEHLAIYEAERSLFGV